MGALGHLILKTIYAHWPDHFNFVDREPPSYYKNANHDVAPNVFLNNDSVLDPDHKNKLYELAGKPSIILAHNAGLIPEELCKQAIICNVYCDDKALATALFLAWCKSSKSRLEFIHSHNQELSIYQAEFLQMLKFVNLNINVQGNININFWDLNSLQSLIPLLDCVKSDFGLGNYVLKTDWYNKNYARSVENVNAKEEFVGFTNVFLKAKANNLYKIIDYADFYNNEEITAFEKSIDYIHSLHNARMLSFELNHK